MDFITNKTLDKLKYDLVREKFLSFDELMECEKLSKTRNENLGQILIEKNYISEDDFLKFLEEKLRIPSVDLKTYSLDEKYLGLISKENARKHVIIPLFKIENVLTVAMDDPLDIFILDELIEDFGDYKIEPVICSRDKIIEAIDKYYKDTEEISSHSLSEWKENIFSGALTDTDIDRTIENIINQAINENVFEIHIEPNNDGSKIFFSREEIFSISEIMNQTLLSRLKQKAKLDSSISAVPQSSNFDLIIDEKLFNISISTFPTIKGEKVVLRLYKAPRNFDEWSIDKETKNTILSDIEKSGIILVCGRHMSGKTYFIYSLLEMLASLGLRVFSLESGVKFNLASINQSELGEKAGFDMNKAIDHIEKQNPDVVYFERLSTISQLETIITLVLAGKLVIVEFETNDKEAVEKIISNEALGLAKDLVLRIIEVNKDKITIK